MNYLEKIEASVAFIKGKTDYIPSIGLVLGSGLGSMADKVEEAFEMDYSDIPHFPASTVEGHEGKLVIGKLNGKVVIAMKGRVHFYEGYSMQEISFPVRVMKALGIDTLIVTNASGGLNPEFHAGMLMFIEDHINLMGDNPLIGENHSELGPRFPDMSTVYNKSLIALAKETAKRLDISINSGVHSAISGPYYLSKSELRMVRKMGADTVGMSTIPEVIVAAHAGLKVLGICCITDMAIPDDLEPLTHDRVVEVANRTRPKFIQLVSEIIKEM